MADETQKLGRYILLEKLAQGGMAQIFKAKTIDQNGFERLVVIKRILPHISQDPEYVDMLIDEAKIAVHFTHGNIAQIYDLGRVGTDYFIVMEFVDGKTLSQINKRLQQIGRPFPIDILLYCFIEACKGLSYVHGKKGEDGKNLGVVHRDVSPQNIILSYAGNIKIIDFGVAKARKKEGKTESGVLKGKFAYMSPEQAQGDAVTFHSDIFALGILLWEMATGRRLFKGKTNHETVENIRKAKLVSACELRADLPKELDKILKRALQKRPKDRFEDAGAMARELEKLLFTINPEFKTVYAAEFVYRLFGPMEDEKDLPAQIFVKEETPVTKMVALSEIPILEKEEITEKEAHEGDDTPVVHIVPKRRFFAGVYLWWVATLTAIFILGSVYVYFVSRNTDAFLSLRGADTHMKVSLNGALLTHFDDIRVPPDTPLKLVVKQDGFEDFHATVNLQPFEKKVFVVVMKRKLPTNGSLLVVTSPPGATVYVDNVEWGQKTPVTIGNLSVGKTVKIGLYLEKHEFHTAAVKIEELTSTRLTHKFEMNFAYLSVKSNPLGAQVEIGGEFVGLTPYQSHNIEPNSEIEVTVTKEGFKPAQTRFKLLPGEEKAVNFDLEELVQGDRMPL